MRPGWGKSDKEKKLSWEKRNFGKKNTSMTLKGPRKPLTATGEGFRTRSKKEIEREIGRKEAAQKNAPILEKSETETCIPRRTLIGRAQNPD